MTENPGPEPGFLFANRVQARAAAPEDSAMVCIVVQQPIRPECATDASTFRRRQRLTTLVTAGFALRRARVG